MSRALPPNTTEQVPLSRSEDRSELATTVCCLVGYKVQEVERELILSSLSHYRGNRTWTANVLGISIRTLRNKINEYMARGMTVARPLNGVYRMPDCPASAELLQEHFNSAPVSETASSTEASSTVQQSHPTSASHPKSVTPPASNIRVRRIQNP
jgi:hypothetical protein